MKVTIRNESDRRAFISAIQRVKLKEGKDYSGEFKMLVKRRSLPQNSLMWLWLTAVAIQSESGYSKDDFYKYYAEKYLPRKDVMGESVITGTSELSTKDFTDFLNTIYDHSLETFACELVRPDDRRFDDFYSEYYGRVI